MLYNLQGNRLFFARHPTPTTMNIITDSLFNRTLADMPAITKTTVRYTKVNTRETIETLTVEIPTADVFESGDWLSRRTAGVKFTKVIEWLCARGYNRNGVDMWTSVA